MDQAQAIKILNREKEFEEKLVSTLSIYFTQILPNIVDISEEESQKIQESLGIIREESIGHSESFNNLLMEVMQRGKDNY